MLLMPDCRITGEGTASWHAGWVLCMHWPPCTCCEQGWDAAAWKQFVVLGIRV